MAKTSIKANFKDFNLGNKNIIKLEITGGLNDEQVATLVRLKGQDIHVDMYNGQLEMYTKIPATQGIPYTVNGVSVEVIDKDQAAFEVEQDEVKPEKEEIPAKPERAKRVTKAEKVEIARIAALADQEAAASNEQVEDETLEDQENDEALEFFEDLEDTDELQEDEEQEPNDDDLPE